MVLDTVYNIDCFEGLQRLPDKSIDLVLTDPPYKIDTGGGGMVAKCKFIKELEPISNGFNTEILDELCRVLKKINIYLFCSRDQIIPLLDYFVKQRKCNFNLLTWHKTNPVPACGNKYLSDTEYILFFREQGVPIYGSVETKKTYYVTPINTEDKNKFGHPTCKPVAILKNLIENSTKTGDVVLDPFIGSGSTAVAAIVQNRRFLGYEINKTYYDTAIARINEESNTLF